MYTYSYSSFFAFIYPCTLFVRSLRQLLTCPNCLILYAMPGVSAAAAAVPLPIPVPVPTPVPVGERSVRERRRSLRCLCSICNSLDMADISCNISLIASASSRHTSYIDRLVYVSTAFSPSNLLSEFKYCIYCL